MAELQFSLRDTLLKLLEEKRYYSLRDLFNTMNPADIAADRTAALQTMPCDHLVLYLYIIPHTLPADNEIDATRPFGIEVRISYAGRRLRTEKRAINQWSGASVEMRVDSKK